MRILSIIVKTVAFLGFAAVAATTAAKEPHWHYPEFQKPVIDWLKSNTAEDVSVNVVSITRPELTEAEARKYFYTTKNGKYPLLSVVATQLATPAEAYLWEGGIWRADQPVVQSFLKDKSHGLDSGQLWIPGHPNAANVLAWIYQLDEPWNPYYKNAAVAKRAAIISLVDLLVQPENSFYYGDARSTNPGRKFIGKDGTWNVHPGQKGFTLTFQAFTMLHTRDLVPAPVRSAWHEGFKLIADRFYVSSNTGPGNMLLSGAIAFQYARLATQDPYYDKLYQYWQDRIVTGKMLSPAGVYYDGFNRAPDASYEGIALHRIAELYAINPTETVRDILEKSYTLKSYMTIVEPDGSRISPSHFNDRCASGFATDQYGGREVMIAADIPAVAPFLRAVWPEKIDPEKVADMMMRTSQKTISASPGPYPWGKGNGAHYRMFDWEGVLQLPYVLYYQDPDKLSEVISNGPGYPLLEFDRYTKNFGDEFYAVRRPAYAAWFYTGHANASDSGATNLKGAVKGDGGYFNGFAGGGLSAFWVPEAGTGLIGRITATEGYQRVTKHNRFVPGWMDWANNHIIGVLDSGKILTSARTSRPENRIETQADGTERLTIASDFVANLRKQGNILNHPGSYRRSYAFFDSHIAVDVAVKFWGPTRFKTLHETLPVYFPGSVSIHYFNGDHQPLDPGDTKRVTDVSFVVMQRENGGTALAFPTPVAIDSGSEKIVSRQQGPPVPVKALQIFFPGDRVPCARQRRYFL